MRNENNLLCCGEPFWGAQCVWLGGCCANPLGLAAAALVALGNLNFSNFDRLRFRFAFGIPLID